MERTLNQKLLAEFVGTFTLIFVGAGAIIQTGGNDLVAIAFAHGLAIAVMVSSVGHVSGGHFNPAVTIGAWVTQKIDSSDAIAYLAAQLAGAAAAAGLLRAAIPAVGWKAVDLGVPSVLKGISTGDFAEALAAILGEKASGLSATNIVRLKAGWEADYKAWSQRDLSQKRYV